MELKRLVLVAALGAATSLALTTGGFAQGVPAEQPPSGFSGDQYVDSTGCVFIRAGVAGAVEWIPRVGRDRRQICGQTPSGGTRTAAAPAQQTRPAASGSNGVVVIGAPTATASRPAPAPTTPSAAPAAPRAVATAPAPRTVVTAPAPAAAPSAPRVVAPTGGCAGLGSRYFSGANVRCGPQAVHPGDAARGIGPQSMLIAPAPVTIPEGYRAAFDDDRLNPMRGIGTPRGDAQMALVWTDTVPRTLVDTNTGRSVAHLFPALRYPHTSMSAQNAAVSVTASTRSIAPRTRSVITPEIAAAPARAAAPELRVPAGHRHVLATTTPDRAEADRAYARLAASGVPARLGQINRSSGMVYAVVAGPFATPDALVRGLQTTRSVGFSDAITRR